MTTPCKTEELYPGKLIEVPAGTVYDSADWYGSGILESYEDAILVELLRFNLHMDRLLRNTNVRSMKPWQARMLIERMEAR